MMIRQQTIDFLSRWCGTTGEHSECAGAWQGLGFQVLCNCECHKEKRVVRQQTGTAVGSLFQSGVLAAPSSPSGVGGG
jgi:hypothetical protein